MVMDCTLIHKTVVPNAANRHLALVRFRSIYLMPYYCTCKTWRMHAIHLARDDLWCHVFVLNILYVTVAEHFSIVFCVIKCIMLSRAMFGHYLE